MARRLNSYAKFQYHKRDPSVGGPSHCCLGGRVPVASLSRRARTCPTSPHLSTACMMPSRLLRSCTPPAIPAPKRAASLSTRLIAAMAAQPGTFKQGLGLSKEGWYTEVSSLWPGQGLSLQVDEVLFQGRSDFQVRACMGRPAGRGGGPGCAGKAKEGCSRAQGYREQRKTEGGGRAPARRTWR